ncbi:formyltransferase family protein [Gemmatimonas phototrophica]|uniref:formyltransferase family protein n=1 Tax=Gemmatimonas phototrophica TaxID=1379270 RepID=UPI0006A6CC0D|nr:formyltransferase family protein [Gemmatimonas phototrophica]
MRAAAAWLERAQDATSDGGIVGRYSLRNGWSSSYPETTGYLVPTLLALATSLNAPRFVERAKRAIDFLLTVQLPSGAFPGGEVHENTSVPSVFNTGQILNGLQAWHAHSHDQRVLDAAIRAAEWLCTVQDTDGAWRQHIYNGLVTTYTTHASCWLAEFGQYTAEPRYVRAAERHMDWALSHQDAETGWIDLMGFSPDDHRARQGVTHTIAYTLWGVLATAEVCGRTDAIAAVTKAAEGILRRVELSGTLPGILNRNWRKASDFTCLTGNAQMALIFLRLYSGDNDPRKLNVALRLIDAVCGAQQLDHGNPGVRGGIAGSFPVWGSYIYASLPNWAAKFFIDAVLMAERALAKVPNREPSPVEIPEHIPRALPEVVAATGSAPLRMVMLASPYVHKVTQMVETWRSLGIRPVAVLIEAPAAKSRQERLLTRARDDGFEPILARLRGKSGPSWPLGDAEDWETDVKAYCTREDIPFTTVSSLSEPEALQFIRSQTPDVLVHAGAGLLRAPLLEIPRLGTINAHMGQLPWFRGMNVTEWAIFSKAQVGCTVHLIDPGIDTGDILCVRNVDVQGARSLADARKRVDAAQVQLLGEVLAFTARSGMLPPRFSQQVAQGRQYFRMHPKLRAIMDAEMRTVVTSS